MPLILIPFQPVSQIPLWFKIISTKLKPSFLNKRNVNLTLSSGESLHIKGIDLIGVSYIWFYFLCETSKFVIVTQNRENKRIS